MAQRLNSITLGAPGFKGLNTEDSPIGLDPQFAQRADNCIIDRYGRLGARKGFDTQTAASELTKLDKAGEAQSIRAIQELSLANTSNYLVATGNNKIFRVDTTTDNNDTLTEFTLPVGYTIENDDWSIVDFNEKLYFFQGGKQPLLTDTTFIATPELVTLDSQSGVSTPVGDIAMGAFGRVWLSGIPDNPSIVYWSDLYVGSNFTGGSSGSIDITQVWPNGYDEVVALASHNDKLIIFGRDNIVMYAGATSPANMTLYDVISGAGCTDKNSVVYTGSDVLFLSSTGMRSLGRSLADKGSLPISDISNNIRRDLLLQVDQEEEFKAEDADTGNITCTYFPEDALLLMHFFSDGTTYAFDTRVMLPDGSRRVTRWPGSLFRCSYRTSDGVLYVGSEVGVGRYRGYLDDGATYQFSYESPILTFGEAARLKIVKQIQPTFIGGSNVDAIISWSYGFDGLYTSATINLRSGQVAEYNIAEYNAAEYSGGIYVTNETVNASGSGSDVRIKIQCDISGAPFSVQEIGILALLGRII